MLVKLQLNSLENALLNVLVTTRKYQYSFDQWDFGLTPTRFAKHQR